MASAVATMIIAGLAAVCAAAESMPSASDLLDRYTQALDSTLSFVEHYEKSVTFGYRHYNGQMQDSGIQFVRGQVRHDGQRLYLQQYRWGRAGGEDYPKDKPDYSLNILDDREKMAYQHDRVINNPRSSGTVQRRPTRTGHKLNLGKYFGLSYIVGYVGSDERLDAILRKAYRISVRETTENVRGSKCFVIDADTKYGQYTVWLDPEHGYHPAKVRRWAKGGNYTHGRLLGQGETATTYLDTVRFEQVEDIWVPMEADDGCYRVMPSGDFVKEDYHYKRTQIMLNPDHDKLGSFADPLFEDPSNDPELRNGTRIKIGAPETKHSWQKRTWQDGKLIDENGRAADMDELRAIGKERLRRGGR